MKRDGGEAAAGVVASVVEDGAAFSFVQVLRLLQSPTRGEEGDGRCGAKEITVVPELSLAFPAADVAKVEPVDAEAGGHRVCVNFLGLYGVSSPLPTFYTEELIDEAAADGTVRRQFLDILHRRLFELHFECWRKYRIWVGVGEGDAPLLERLFSLAGVPDPEVREGVRALEPLELLRYAGLLGHSPRSASGLATLLSDALEGVPVSVVQCVGRTVPIAPGQRLRLGEGSCTLGVDCVAGTECADAAGKFRLQIGVIGKELFQSLLPGRSLYRKVVELVELYLTHPLEFDLELLLRSEDVATVRLGSACSALLGLNSWCFAGSPEADRLWRAVIGGDISAEPDSRCGS